MKSGITARILLIDDEPLVLEMFESALSSEGYDVVLACNGQEAVSLLESTFFDLAVCDVMMDGLDGFDFLNLARRKNPSMGVVLITGAPSNNDALRAAGLNALYLSKPIGIRALLDTVELVLRPKGVGASRVSANSS